MDRYETSRRRNSGFHAAKILEGNSQHLANQYKDLLPDLYNLEALYKALKKQREQRGAIDFETVETRIVFSKKGKISKIEPVERNVAHKIIEECMLAANVATAKFLKKHKLPGVFRVHEGPSDEKLSDLKQFLENLCFQFNKTEKPTPKDYAKILKAIRPQFELVYHC